MAFTPKRLAQFQAAAAETSYYTVPADTLAVVKNIVIANTSTVDVSLSLSIVPAGGVAGLANRIVPGLVIPPLSVVPLDVTQVMAAGDFISAIASLAASLTVTISGMEDPGSNGLSAGTVIGSPPLWGSPVATGDANADGVAGSLPRADHVHKGILAVDQYGTPIATGAANAAGASLLLPRADHVHQSVGTATPLDTAAAAAVGAGVLAAREDHVHRAFPRGNKSGAVAGAWSTASTSFVNYGATAVTFTFTKARADTVLFVFAVATGYTNGALGVVLGASIGGTDYAISGVRYKNEASSHFTASAVGLVAGVTAGTKTCTLRIRVTQNTLQTDANDYGDLMIMEGFQVA